ncbi:Predicted lipase [Yersinia mollaretii]|nr:Predicted lipase [Yersinia mollaretii]
MSEYTGNSDASGIIRIKGLHHLDLTLFIEAQPLADEMETRSLRVGREDKYSTVRKLAEQEEYEYQYITIGKLCDKLPTITPNWEDKKKPPAYHFPDTRFTGLTVKKLNCRHVLEICPFRAWSLALHHQNEYSMANALNLGITAAISYGDDDINKKDSIAYFFSVQCQDLSKLPTLNKESYSTNALTYDVPFRQRYDIPVFLDTSKGTAPEGDAQLFYVFNDEHIIVSWRGTASVTDGITDLTFRPVGVEVCEPKVPCVGLVAKGKVHKGFWDSYSLANRKFSEDITKIERLSIEKNIYICGHSLGGALALIHAAKLKDNNPLLYTYGMPRTFTRDAVETLESVVHYRHVNDTDTVPSVPPEANLDNWFYDIYGPLGTVLGGLWSTVLLSAQQVYSWGDCFWHHGNPVVFFAATQTEEWKDCKVTQPYPRGCITLKQKLSYTAKLYLVPALAEVMAQSAGQEQKSLVNVLTQKDLEDYFPRHNNPDRDHITSIFKHFMTAYMPYINNKLLDMLDAAGLSGGHKFHEHRDTRERFAKQLANKKEVIPVQEFKRNSLFLSLEDLLPQTLTVTKFMSGGTEALERFAAYGKEDVE